MPLPSATLIILIHIIKRHCKQKTESDSRKEILSNTRAFIVINNFQPSLIKKDKQKYHLYLIIQLIDREIPLVIFLSHFKGLLDNQKQQ